MERLPLTCVTRNLEGGGWDCDTAMSANQNVCSPQARFLEDFREPGPKRGQALLSYVARLVKLKQAAVS